MRFPRRKTVAVGYVALLVTLAACPLEPGPSAAGSTKLLTSSQHAHAIQDLLGDVVVPEVSDPSTTDDAFIHEAGLRRLDGALLHQYRLAAETVAEQAKQQLDSLVPCSGDQRACAAAFIDDFAARAFRRPLRDADRAALLSLYDLGREEGFATGIALVIEAVLQSPDFLYRTALGDPSERSDVVELTPHELASEVSFLLLDSIPDEALRRAAEDGSLAQPEVLRKQVDRLLSTPQVQEHLADLVLRWLGATRIDRIAETAVYEQEIDPKLAASMGAETRLFVHDVLWQRGGRLSELLTSSETFVDARLAAHYGVEGITTDEPMRTTLDPAQRSGILFHASVLTSLGSITSTSIVRRGNFISHRLLCQALGTPPRAAIDAVAEETAEMSDRERVDYRAGNPACSACHAVIDPPGVALEHYDGRGAWRNKTGGAPVDANTTIALSGAEPQQISGPAELALVLAQDPGVGACVVEQFLEYAFGRKLDSTDAATREMVLARFVASGGSLVEIFRAVPETPSFRYRTEGAP